MKKLILSLAAAAGLFLVPAVQDRAPAPPEVGDPRRLSGDQALVGDRSAGQHVDPDPAGTGNHRRRQGGDAVIAQTVDADRQAGLASTRTRDHGQRRGHGRRNRVAEVASVERRVPEILDDQAVDAARGPGPGIPKGVLEHVIERRAGARRGRQGSQVNDT